MCIRDRYWNDTYRAFCHVLTQMDAETADSVLLDEMVYLIARDNEAEGFIQETTSHPQWFECLCRRAAASNEDVYKRQDLFCDLLEENANTHPKYQGDCGDWLNWTVPDTDCNLPIFASGWGDGYYPVYLSLIHIYRCDTGDHVL